MTDQKYLPAQFFLKPGYVMANQDATIVRTILGNCVAVTFFDQNNRFGGINQFVFPKTDRREDMTPQYGNVGIKALFRMLMDMGASRHSLVAQIVGGAECRNFNDKGLGLKNVNLARLVLEQLRVPIVSEDVGGSMGRKIMYHSGTNEMAIFKVNAIGKDDWFAPGMDLRFDTFGR